MKKVKHTIEILRSIPISYYVCVKLLGFKKALRLPIFVRYNTHIISLKGEITILGRGRIKIGFGKTSEFDKKYERNIIKFNGNITFHSPCSFGQGCKIISEKNSKMEIGENFHNSAKLTISNRGHISIGCGAWVSWDTWICDTDFHQVIDIETGEASNPNGEVIIGNNVWIAANSMIMKGAQIPDGCIIGTGSLVRNPFSDANCLLAGSPAKVKRQNVTWKK